MRQNLRGEMTLSAVQTQFKANSSSKLIGDVLALLRSENLPVHGSDSPVSPSNRGAMDSQKILIPMMLNHSARHDDMEGIKTLLGEYDSLINVGDCYGKVLTLFQC